MQRGTPITVFHGGFRIGEENLAAIGVVTGSTCWGVRVPDRNKEGASENASQFSHYLISPFEPSSWPILLRVEMCIDGDKPEALALAIKPLADEGLSILSIDVTPAGHRHSVVTIIGEALGLKQEIRARFNGLAEWQRTYRNPNTWELVHTVLAPLMLKKSAQIVHTVEHSDKREKFLRAIFLDPELNPRFERGVVYSHSDLPDDTKKLGKEQRTPAVRCTWLQNHAFFWLYSKAEYLQLHYDGALHLMTVEEIDLGTFSEGLKDFVLPFKAIALIDQAERFLRVVLSADDLQNRTVHVTIPFQARYQFFQGSKGFQHKLYAGLAKSGLKLRHASMSTHHRVLDMEEGELSLLIAKTKEARETTPYDLRDPVDKLRESVQATANKAAESLRDQQCTMWCKNIAIRGFSAPLLFLSTKFEWMSDFGKNLRDEIKEMAITAGFNLVTVDTTKLGELRELVPETKRLTSLTDVVQEVIRQSAAFMQIIPGNLEEQKTEDGFLNWLLFEFGAAQALRLPCTILVDVSARSGDIEEWKKKLRVGNDFPLHAFRSDRGSEPLRGAVKIALEELAKRSDSRTGLSN
jgi:hypothetical protein